MEGYQEKKVEDVHVPHGDIAELLQDKEDDDADAELRESFRQRRETPLKGASEGREDHEKRKSHKLRKHKVNMNARRIMSLSCWKRSRRTGGKKWR